MSDKLLHNQLDDLFAELGDFGELPTPAREAPTAGWTFSCDADGQYTECSQEVHEVLGIPPDDMLGKPLARYALTADSAEELEFILKNGQFPVELRLNFRNSAGELVPVLLHIQRSPSPNGAVAGWEGSVQILEESEVENLISQTQAFDLTAPDSPREESALVEFAPDQAIPEIKPLLPEELEAEPEIAPLEGDADPSEIETGQEFSGGPETSSPPMPEDFVEPPTIVEISETPPEASPTTIDPPPEMFQSTYTGIEESPDALVDVPESEPDAVPAGEPVGDSELEEFTRESYFLDPAALEEVPPVDGKERIADPEIDRELQAPEPEGAAADTPPPRITTGPLPPIETDGPIESQLPAEEVLPREAEITPLHPAPRGTGILRLSEAEAKPATQDSPAILTVPVHLQDNPIGQLEIVDDTPNRVWTDDDRRLVEEIADQLSLALENAQLFAQTQKALDQTETQAKRLALLNNMSEMLSRCSNLDEVYSIAPPKTLETLPSDWVSLALLGVTGQEYTVVASQGIELETRVGHRAALQGSEIEPAVKERRVVIKTTSNTTDMRDIQTFMVAPLIASGKIIGTLSIGRQEALFEPRDENLLLQIASLLASTIEGRRLFEQTESALSETDALFRASAELNAVETYTDILGILQKYSVVGDRARHATIFLFDRPWQWGGVPEWQIRAAHWSESASHQPANRLPLNGWSAAPILLDQENVTIISSIEEDPYLARNDSPLKPELGEAESALLIPLTVGQQWIGYILASFATMRSFSEPQIRRVSSLAGQAAVAIENLRLLEETRSRARQLQTAAEIARDASEVLAVEELLQRSVRLIADRFGFYHTSIYLLDEDSATAVNWASAGSAEVVAERGSQRVKVGSRSVIGYVTQTGPLVINDVRQSPIHEPDPDLPETRAELGIPMKIGDRVIGALDVQSIEDNPFSPDDVAVLQTLTDQIAVAVDNARSYELAQEAFREARQRLQELSMLYNVSQSFAGAPLEIEEIANLIARQFVKILRVPECTVATLDEAREILRVLVDLQVDEEGEFIDLENIGKQVYTGDYSGASRVLDTFRPLVIDLSDPDSEPTLQAELAEGGYKNRAIFPLVVKNQPIGLIDLKSRTAGRLSSKGAINLASTLANQAAIALENARLYQDQFRAVEQLREVDILKSQFLANMSHELRTPLNSIIGFSRVILKGIDGPVTKLQKQDLTAIYNAGQHLLGLINDILDLSKIEAGKMELSYEEVDIGELINSVMSTAIGLVKHKPIQLKKDLAMDLPQAYGDPLRIRQVLLNLLSYAAKFTEEGTITVEAVTAPRAHRDGKLVIVRVTDTGPGISEADQAKLFQPFSQVDASPTRKSGGTGLGLSISRHLIEMHNGTIAVESEMGKGSTFYFSLLAVEPGSEPPQVPVSSGVIEPAVDRMPHSKAPDLTVESETPAVVEIIEVDLEPEPDIYENVPVTVEAPDLPQTGELPGDYVLAVDKDEQIIRMYERYLQPQGYQVLPATTADNAIKIAEHRQPVLITLDVMAPQYDGWQLLESLKTNPKTAHIPVVICSIVEERDKAAAHGAADYLVKPILESDLLDVVNRIERSPSEDTVAGETQPKRVLIVDQDPADIRVLKMLLEEDGLFHLEEAKDGRQSLELLLADPPEALILTSALPDMDAFTFIKTMRANPSIRSIPIILMVEQDMTPEIEQQLGRNCEAVFHKAKLNQEKLLQSLQDATS